MFSRYHFSVHYIGQFIFDLRKMKKDEPRWECRTQLQRYQFLFITVREAFSIKKNVTIFKEKGVI